MWKCNTGGLGREWGAPRAQSVAAVVVAALLMSVLPLASDGAAQTSPDGTDAAREDASAGAAGTFWDGTGSLAVALPTVADQGQCAALGGGTLALFGTGSVSAVCSGASGDLSGSPKGVAWVEGIDQDGLYAHVMLLGGSELTAETYRALGELDAVFEGGALAADFARCVHEAGAGWSSCRAGVVGTSVPPGRFVGVGTVGIAIPVVAERVELAGSAARSAVDDAATPAAQRAALVALFDATGGATWTRNANWNTAAPVEDWYGVTTDATGSVTRLYLGHNALSGSIPAELGDLAELERLNLSSNALSGSIPAELGDLAELRRLDLSSNALSGSIPAELGDLAELERLNLRSNDLSGSIPAELGDPSGLEWLLLDFNALSESIPAELGDLDDLEFLTLSGNALTGSVPAELGSLERLRGLFLSGNALSGPIPAELGDLGALEWLGLGYDVLRHRSRNQFTGPIPIWLGDLENLSWLDLAGNRLTGPIPAGLGGLADLTWLSLAQNSLNGPIPEQLSALVGLTWLDMSYNSLSGAIPAWLGNATGLQRLWLNDNQMSGPIPGELGRLVNLESLALANNRLSGRIPGQLDNLASLRSLFLQGNNLTGCMPPANLTGASVVRIDPRNALCARPLVRVSDATAREDDDAAVFTLSVVWPEPDRRVPGLSEIAVDVQTRRGSASSRADYWDVTATITIPADEPYATVSVPIIDDTAAESDETFTLHMSNPAGATLWRFWATATIHDDDPATTTTPTPAAVCGDAALHGTVAGVFDIAQAGFADYAHAFVDIDVTCGGESAQIPMPIAVVVTGGPVSSLGPASHCIVNLGRWNQGTTTSVTTGAWCARTHLVRIPDRNIGQMHQILVWADADRDDVHDAGEPYQYVATDFVGRSQRGATLVDYRLPQNFEARVLDGGVISRAGQWTEVRIGLGAVIKPGIDNEHLTVPARTVPLTDAPTAAFVSVGPSSTARMHCVAPSTPHAPSASRTGTCMTDQRGHVTFRWRAPADAAHALRRGRDTIRVFIDRDQDGVYDPDPLDILAASAGAEPSATFDVDIAKTVNYVALGDSYSSGEAGELPPTGLYQTGVSPADAHCRRWSEAYPEVFARDVLSADDLGINVTFATYACTGAETTNVYDPRTLTVDDFLDTNRASSAVPAGSYADDEFTYPNDWEPRQAASLAAAQAMGDVDMITITIGGNDAGFAGVLISCVLPHCRNIDQSDYSTIGDRVADIAARIRRVARDASVFVLGYPHVTPQPTECPSADESCPELGLNQFIDECPALSAAEIVAQSVDQGLISDVPIVGFGRFRASINDVADVAALALSGSLKIDHLEAQALWYAVAALNSEIRDAARQAGVHFVDVVGGVPIEGSPLGFIGHSPCHEGSWLNGYVVDATRFPAYSDRSFHPSAAGHEGYARLLERYIRNHYTAGTDLSESGLPINPGPRP